MARTLQEQAVSVVTASAWLDVLFARSVSAMALTDPRGRLLDANAALCSMLGFSVVDLRAMSGFSGFGALEIEGALRRTSAGEGPVTVVFDRALVTAHGRPVQTRVTATAVPGPDGEWECVLLQVQAVGALIPQPRGPASMRDELTGLAQRHEFYGRLERVLTHRLRAKRRVAVLIVNLNRFQQVNAGLGHVAADLILVQVARRLMAVAGPNDLVARLGGDWFAILATEVTNAVDAVALAVRIRHGLGEPYWAAGNPIFVSARVGVVTAPADGTDAGTLMRQATSASNQAKGYTSGWAMPVGSDRTSREELSLVSDLQTAIDDGELTVDYQPIVDGEGRLHSLEALARWQHPTRGAVAPDQFIVLAEQYGLIGTLTNRVLTSTVEQAARWASLGGAHVAVNLSGKLLADPKLVDEVAVALAAVGLPASAMTLEITESALADGSNPVVRDALHALRAAGVHISIDDFGTGYSSLAYLKELPVDEVKVDRSFVTDLATNERAERIVRSIVDLAHSLDLDVVAEGVEEEATAEHLLRLGVDYLQGYGIARPAGEQTMTEWLRRQPGESAAARRRAEAGRRLNVLIVDDQVANRTALRARLADDRHRVVEASSGGAALDKLRKRMPDVVILDHLMPGLTGVDTVPILREAGYAGPILLYSDALPDDLAAIRLPLDVWPVSKADEATFTKLIEGYARASAARAAQR